MPKDASWEALAYNNRWKKVREVLLEFDTVSLEAEVIWGQDAVSLAKDMRRQIAELKSVVETFILMRQQSEFVGDFTAEMRDVLYFKAEDDGYNKALRQVISAYEEFLKVHLKHN